MAARNFVQQQQNRIAEEACAVIDLRGFTRNLATTGIPVQNTNQLQAATSTPVVAAAANYGIKTREQTTNPTTPPTAAAGCSSWAVEVPELDDAELDQVTITLPAIDLNSDETPCVFCDSLNTKMEGFNSVSQPRYRCKDCKKRFTKGGKLRKSRQLIALAMRQERGL